MVLNSFLIWLTKLEHTCIDKVVTDSFTQMMQLAQKRRRKKRKKSKVTATKVRRSARLAERRESRNEVDYVDVENSEDESKDHRGNEVSDRMDVVESDNDDGNVSEEVDDYTYTFDYENVINKEYISSTADFDY